MSEQMSLERWGANVSAGITIGLLIGGIVSCSVPAYEHKFELVTTVGGVIGALLVMVICSVPSMTPASLQFDDLPFRLGHAAYLFWTKRISYEEYMLMRETIIRRFANLPSSSDTEVR